MSGETHRYHPGGNEVNATDCRCCKCGAQAVAFWPVVDPDIPASPYCRECLNKAKHDLLCKLSKQGWFGV